MKTTLIIPAAGEGKRFKDAGYTQPKPLIPVNGQPMIRAALDCFWLQDCGDWNFEAVVISQKDAGISDGAITNIVLNDITCGPACTVLKAKGFFDNDPLIITNCDQIILDQWVMDMADFARIHNPDVILGCFISTSPKNSYVRLNDEGQIIEVREKEVISNIATNGLHWFRRGSDFVRGAEKMIEADDRVNGEFYIAPSVNYLIAEGLKVMPFFFNLHFPVGTPEDLQKYEAIHAKT
jgi:dTDP-glucose pyrophosphorylase